MSGFDNPLARRPRPGISETTRRLKQAARAALGVPDHVTVSVTELTCREDGCPDVETVVAVLAAGEPPRLARIHKPLLEATADDVAAAFAKAGG